MPAAKTSPPAVAIDPARDLVVLPYSSGTTGLPKGVMLTHRHLVANLRQCEGMEGFEHFGERDVVIAALPFFHIEGPHGRRSKIKAATVLLTFARPPAAELLGAAEKFASELEVLLACSTGEVRKTKLSALLPDAFHGGSLPARYHK